MGNDMFIMLGTGRILPERVDSQLIQELMLKTVLESEDKEETLLGFMQCCQDIKKRLESREGILL